VLPHVLAQGSGSGSSGAATIFAILASAVIVLGGLGALIRAVWKWATTMRDNTTATQKLTERLDTLVASVDGQMHSFGERLAKLERGAGSEP
jgi:hypothetical protein